MSLPMPLFRFATPAISLIDDSFTAIVTGHKAFISSYFFRVIGSASPQPRHQMAIDLPRDSIDDRPVAGTSAFGFFAIAGISLLPSGLRLTSRHHDSPHRVCSKVSDFAVLIALDTRWF